MANDGDARAAEVYADSDSGEDFYGFSDQAGDSSSSSSSESDSVAVSVSESESESDGVVVGGVRRRGRGRGRGRGRDRQAQGDGLGDGVPVPHPTLPDGSQVIWQPDVGAPAAACDQWLPPLRNDVSEPAFDGREFGPLDFFLKTFPLVLLNLLCTETNRYFTQWSQQQAVNESIRKAWFDVDVAEMKVFIALLIFMGLDRRYSYRSYWSTHWMLGMPGFRSVMPRDRFFAILRFLHICDNLTAVPRGQPGHDRAFKIRPMITSLVTAWQAAYKIGKSVSVDECMVPFKGRVSMLQYMPKKPNKWGLKGWVLAASDSGYAYNWKLYTGKEDDRVAVGLGESVVLAMTECLPAGHVVYCDNFFTGVSLALSLERRGIGSCGTVRANRRGLPIQLNKFATARKATMQLTSPLFLRSSKMLAVGWFDKRPVCLLTNIHSTETVTKQRRGHPDFEKPVAIECYTQNMGGVDSADQYNSYYPLTKRSYKWWKKVFMHLLVTAVSNAYILHRSSAAVKLPSCDFRLQLAEQLIEGFERVNVMRGRPIAAEQLPLRLSGRHFLQHCGESRPECVVCTKRQDGRCVKRKRTAYRCKTCVPSVALCVIPCFEIYHTKLDYRAVQ